MAPDTGTDVLVADLAALGRSLPRPGAGAGLTDAVMARLADAPPPQTESSALRAVRWVIDAVGRRRSRAAVVVTALLLALLAAPPVRAAVADWFGFAGVIVRDDGSPASSEAPPPPTVGAATTLDEASQLVGFDPLVPAVLGSPQGVEVSADRRVLSMSWTDEVDGTVRLDQFDGRVDFAFAKTSPGVDFTSVADEPAMWFDMPHEVVFLNRDGTRRTETARLAGHTLIWEHDETALRLEGDVSLSRAIEIARSVAALP